MSDSTVTRPRSKRRPLAERFWEKVDRPDDPSACWIWVGTRLVSGYGCIRVDARTRRAHQVAYELVNGPIPEGIGYHGTCVLHRCDIPLCVNPSHLFLGTQRDNMLDRDAKGRGLRGETVGVAKLTDAKVRAIRLHHGMGMTQRDLGVMFGINQSNISRVCRAETWSHVK